MIKKILKYFSIIITPIAILALIAYISVLQLPEKIAIGVIIILKYFNILV